MKHIFKKRLIFIKTFHSKDEILYELALMINTKLYMDNKISYSLYDLTQSKLLKKLKVESK